MSKVEGQKSLLDPNPISAPAQPQLITKLVVVAAVSHRVSLHFQAEAVHRLPPLSFAE